MYIQNRGEKICEATVRTPRANSTNLIGRPGSTQMRPLPPTLPPSPHKVSTRKGHRLQHGRQHMHLGVYCNTVYNANYAFSSLFLQTKINGRLKTIRNKSKSRSCAKYFKWRIYASELKEVHRKTSEHGKQLLEPTSHELPPKEFAQLRGRKTF